VSSPTLNDLTLFVRDSRNNLILNSIHTCVCECVSVSVWVCVCVYVCVCPCVFFTRIILKSCFVAFLLLASSWRLLFWLLLYAHRHRSILLGAAGHIILTPVDGNGAQNMVTVQSGFWTRDLTITDPTRLRTPLTGPTLEIGLSLSELLPSGRRSISFFDYKDVCNVFHVFNTFRQKLATLS
jgi:hypothetical protein